MAYELLDKVYNKYHSQGMDDMTIANIIAKFVANGDEELRDIEINEIMIKLINRIIKIMKATNIIDEAKAWCNYIFSDAERKIIAMDKPNLEAIPIGLWDREHNANNGTVYLKEDNSIWLLKDYPLDSDNWQQLK